MSKKPVLISQVPIATIVDDKVLITREHFLWLTQLADRVAKLEEKP